MSRAVEAARESVSDAVSDMGGLLGMGGDDSNGNERGGNGNGNGAEL